MLYFPKGHSQKHHPLILPQYERTYIQWLIHEIMNKTQTWCTENCTSPSSSFFPPTKTMKHMLAKLQEDSLNNKKPGR